MGVTLSCLKAAPTHETSKLDAYWDEAHERIIQASEILRSGALRLLSAQWLLQQPPTWIVQRRQDLPVEAFIHPAEAAPLFRKAYGIVALSYGWLSKHHPDPQAFHFRILQSCLALLWPILQRFQMKDAGVFWDFASLPQEPRLEEEAAIFWHGLRMINFVYGSPHSIVLLQKMMPDTGADQLNLRPYAERGWCIFEEAISCILKPSARCLDLGRIDQAQLDAYTTWRSEDMTAPGLTETCTASRSPPTRPDDMDVILAIKSFTNRADCQMVAQKYRDFFELLCLAARELVWPRRGGEGWGQEQVHQLVQVLPSFGNARLLNLREHPFDDASIGLLSAVLPSLRELRGLRLDGCASLGPASVAHLTEVLQEMPALRLLALPGHLEGSKESQHLSDVWRRLGKPRGEAPRPRLDSGGLYFV